MIDELLKKRAKNALSITVNIPLDGEETEEKEDKAVDRPPALDNKKDDIDSIMTGSEPDILRRKKAGEKPRGLRDRVRMSMKE